MRKRETARPASSFTNAARRHMDGLALCVCAHELVEILRPSLPASRRFIGRERHDHRLQVGALAQRGLAALIRGDAFIERARQEVALLRLVAVADVGNAQMRPA